MTGSSTFADLGVSKAPRGQRAARPATSSLPFAVQKLVVPDALDGWDVLAESPTGSGKTLAFGIPLVDTLEPGPARPAAPPASPGALVLAPTRELASSDRRRARARSPERASLSGDRRLRRRRHQPADQGRWAEPRPNVLVATPGPPRRPARLAEPFTLAATSEVLVLDEADRMLDMGFRPVVDRLVRAHARRPPDDAPLGDARRRGRPLFRRASTRTDARRPTRTSPPRRRGRAKSRAPLRQGLRARKKRDTHRQADLRADRGRARAHARVRAHEARRRPAREAARPRRGRSRSRAMHGDKSQASARARAGAVRSGSHRLAGRDRRRRARHDVRPT